MDRDLRYTAPRRLLFEAGEVLLLSRREAAGAVVAFVLLCLLAPFAIDPGFVTPITLQSALVVGLPMVAGWRAGTLAVFGYLAAGAMGLPVFAGGASGISVFAGPSAGFLAGFVIVAALAGWWATRDRRDYIGRVRVFVGAHVVLLACGVIGLAIAGLSAGAIGEIVVGLSPGLVIKSLVGAGLVVAWERFALPRLDRLTAASR